ncbi:aldo/keto reductase [Anaerospora sp.]|uniref:aldo/keto reductase n=1 Tax=Anaerospora sp. TaxID=1960278 RepID=UPI0028973003|nr:aldo/keto reductase [Anaerospora sp.]
MSKGSATLQGTLEYAARHPELIYQVLGQTGLSISGAGFGCYRVDVAVPEHDNALMKALQAGINLIDTSANYADGASERLVGKVLHKLVSQGELKREEIVIVSKAGYLQGTNYQLSQKRKLEGRPIPELVLYDEGLEHCIHPEFIEEQLTGSLGRLQVESIDCYLLHNPEYYLLWAQKQSIDKAEARDEYLRRIKDAFTHLEYEVEKGRISFYGISSNTFPHHSNAYTFTSLTEVWNIAQSISPKHHFRVIEFPLNLFETAGMTEGNQPGGQTLVEFAVEKGIGVLTNRPLNAIREDRLIRLNDAVYQGQAAQEALHFRDKVAALESTWGNACRLNQLAFRALHSTAGISGVLVGMRKEQYVEDVLQELKTSHYRSDKKEIWQRIREL